MSHKNDIHPESGNIESFLDLLREHGRRAGRKFRKIIINDDGSGEVEYEARNPWEVIVIPMTDPANFRFRSPQGSDVGKFLENAVIRKKCTKCFLHQREVSLTDL
jgi:hypothetical protein